MDILEAYSKWKRRELEPTNQRQKALLRAWEAFLEEHETGDSAMIGPIPDAFNELWTSAST